MPIRWWAVGLVLALPAGAAQTPVFPGKDWRRARPESQGVDPVRLEEAVAYMQSTFRGEAAEQLVIVRNGYMIWKGPGAEVYHNIWSATKNFTSTVLGLLTGEGKCSLDDPAYKHFPALERFPTYKRIQLRHLASMSSGYQGEVREKSGDQPWGQPRFYLNPAEPLFEPGAQVQYHDHQVFLLGAILTRLAREPEKAVFQRGVADVIGMTKWDWGVSGEIDGIALNNAAGTPNTPGIQTTASELARFGLLYLNGGKWKGRQVLPASFVEQAGRNQVANTGASRFLHGRYGFYWWTNDPRPDGRRPWPSAPPRTYTSNGNGANFCMVIPEWNMVVVRMGTVPMSESITRSRQQEEFWDGFLSRLGKALKKP